MKKPDPSVAANKRTDDLRKADQKLLDEKIAHIKDVQRLHIDYGREFRDLIMKNAEMAQNNADTKAVNLAELLQQYKSETNAQITELRVSFSNNQGKMAVIFAIVAFLSSMLTGVAMKFFFK
jgi:hypothetical protein